MAWWNAKVKFDWEGDQMRKIVSSGKCEKAQMVARERERLSSCKREREIK
jgi:hypothetical protein